MTETVPLEELAASAQHEAVRARAQALLLAAHAGKAPAGKRLRGEEEALAHALARYLAFHVGGPSLLRRTLNARHPGGRRRPSPELLESAQREGLGLAVHGAKCTVPLLQYLDLAPHVEAWRLCHRQVHRGRVHIRSGEAATLLLEVQARRLLALNPGPPDPAGVRGGPFALLVQGIPVPEPMPAPATGPVVEAAFPPCMRRLEALLGSKEPVSHGARFALVAFLHGTGLDADQILHRFEGRGDFDAHKSRKQIEHITGEGGKEAYAAPGCAKMQSLGLCPLAERDGLCRRIKHPMAYYRVRSQPKAPAPQEAPA
jgi:DNA primase large subunit